MDNRPLPDDDNAVSDNSPTNGIGTLGEKSIHAELKKYFGGPDGEYEVKIGEFIADIRRGDRIIEIQTRNFSALGRKLAPFLEQNSVTVVYPVVKTRWINWIDPATGELSKRRKSPKAGQYRDILAELASIKSYLKYPGLNFCALLIEVEEIRHLAPGRYRKRRDAANDSIPTRILGEMWLDQPSDYIALIPDGLQDEFTVKEYAALAKVAQRPAAAAVSALCALNLLKKSGKRGRAFLYSRTEHTK